MASIEYFYSAHSAFAYLGSARFMAIARAAGRTIEHRPFDLRIAVPKAGAVPFEQRMAAHRDYFFRREIERWAEERDAPVMKGSPTHHRKDMTLPNALLIAAQMAGETIDQLAHVMLEAHWRDDADLADPATLERLTRSVGLDPPRCWRAMLPIPKRPSGARSSARRPTSSTAICSTARITWRWSNGPCSGPMPESGRAPSC